MGGHRGDWRSDLIRRTMVSRTGLEVSNRRHHKEGCFRLDSSNLASGWRLVYANLVSLRFMLVARFTGVHPMRQAWIVPATLTATLLWTLTTSSLALVALAGCEGPTTIDLPATPESALSPKTGSEAAQEAKVKLTPVKSYADLINQLKNLKVPGGKFIVIDAWATWCGPCKENFPHLVEMHEKYAKQGVVVCSLSMDTGSVAKEFAAAEKFLKQSQAVFPNYITENPDEMFESLDISAIPAVFFFSTDGKLLKAFTMEDVNNQFTYEQVEAEIKARLSSPAGE